MKIAIVKYNAGNTLSVQIALQRLEMNSEVTADPKKIRTADKVIFPGQGEASSALESLKENGLIEVLQELKKPLLGICLGQQLLATNSEENNAGGLGIVDCTIKKFPAQKKVPHIGWNTINHLKGPLFTDVPDCSYVYFVHSYYMQIIDCKTATTDYIIPFSSAVQKDNFYAVQFHPEKSGDIGSKILKNFLIL